MKTRVILFARVASGEQNTVPQFVFARWGSTLEIELPFQLGVEDFANRFKFKRHSKFDYAVGEMGKKATLIECVDPQLSSELALDPERKLSLTWEPFRQTAQSFSDGQDRRFLQLAVQFLASGESVDDSVVAAEYDAEFIQQLQKTLTEQNASKDK